VLVIKLSGAAVFVAAVLVGVGLLLTRPALYYVAIGLAGAALLAVILSSFPWRRRPPRYP
jgi:threonine/homoserine/homoserine lactone efflux protein